MDFFKDVDGLRGKNDNLFYTAFLLHFLGKAVCKIWKQLQNKGTNAETSKRKNIKQSKKVDIRNMANNLRNRKNMDCE